MGTPPEGVDLLRVKAKKVSFSEAGPEIRPITYDRGREFSVLDGKPSHVLDFPLTVSQQIWLMFLLPSFICTFIFIFDLATDIGLALAYFEESLVIPALLTLAFTYLPAIVCFVVRLCSPPDDRGWRPMGAWFFIELLAFLVFPLRPLYCFAERIFWSLEAVRLKDPEREDALVAHEESRSRSIESYLFFQAFLHAGPQAILQLILIVWDVSKDPQTVKVQAVGVLTSIASVSLMTALYQRYETQVRGGRLPIWDTNIGAPNEYIAFEPTEQPDGNVIPIPRVAKWTKTMDEDNPIGVVFMFLFWFLFLIGRCVCLVIAARFFVWVVLGVCAGHFLLAFFYILPVPDMKTALPQKILLSFIYIFCIVEVGIQFRKSAVWYSVMFVVTLVENFALTLIWVLWANWSGWWYHYALYLMGITHFMAIMFLLLYIKFFKPEIKRINPQL